jgi:hypothetical protein
MLPETASASDGSGRKSRGSRRGSDPRHQPTPPPNGHCRAIGAVSKPRISLPYHAPVQDLEHAAQALGWSGQLIPDVEVLDTRFAAVARIRPDVHQWRRDHGWEPELNPTWFRSWGEPCLHDQLPVAAVDLLGILVRVARAKRALRACGTLMTLAPCAVVLPGDHPYQPWPLIELDYYGIGVVNAATSGPAELVLAPENRSAEFGSSLFSRWLLEVLYSKALEQHTEIAENA